MKKILISQDSCAWPEAFILFWPKASIHYYAAVGRQMERANRAFLQEAIWGELSWAAGICLGWLVWQVQVEGSMKAILGRLGRWVSIGEKV